MTPAEERQQAALDQVSYMISRLDHDERLIVVVNAFAFSESSPVTVVSSLAQIMVSLSITLDDDEIKMRVVKALRDAAALFEETITSGKVLN